MKKTLTLFLMIISLAFSVNAQGIYQFWGTTTAGGTDNQGVIYSTRFDGTGYTIQKEFPLNNSGRTNRLNCPVAYNGKLYVLTQTGGIDNAGIIAEYNIANNTWTRRADLQTIGGRWGSGRLCVYNNKLYGVCGGGFQDEGKLFEYNPVNHSLTNLYNFNEAGGRSPANGVTLFNNKLYGITIWGGANGLGTIYEFDPANNTYTKKQDFDANAIGYCSSGSKLTVYNNLLWGATCSGAGNFKGALYSFNPATNVLSKKLDMDLAGTGNVNSGLTVLNNRLYGTGSGGANLQGTIFEYNPANNVLSIEHDFLTTEGHSSQELTVYNGQLYGASILGGTGGQLFKFNPVNNVYTALHNYTFATGSSPDDIMLFYNNLFWGTTYRGGNGNNGVLYRFDPSNDTYTMLVQLGGTNLRKPEGALCYFNQKLYGIASFGGIYETEYVGGGGIFEYEVASGNFLEKKHLNASQGIFTENSGMFLLNSKMYGAAQGGGANSGGTLFEYNPLNNNFAVKHNFQMAGGYHPASAPSVYNGKLYGTCTEGGANNEGVIYEFNLANNTYTPKVTMSNAFGIKPTGRMTLFNNKFYGTTYEGGSFDDGTLYEYNPAINGFIKKVDFHDVQGVHGTGALRSLNGKLYGHTRDGGGNDMGIIFEYVAGATSYLKLAEFDFTDGYTPLGSMIAFNNKLYGTASDGGANGKGTIFAFDPANQQLEKKSDFSPIAGQQVTQNDLIAIPALTAPGSPNSCVNAQTINITAANANEWIPFTDAQGRSVAEINANGNILGSTTVRWYINGGAMRQDGNGDYYLDRNITITPTTQPASPVSIRMYIRKAELDDIIAQPGSNITQASDLHLFRNGDFCAANLTATTTALTTLQGSWGSEYVYIASTDSLASFYLKGAPAAPLPVYLLSFEGKKEANANRLTWKATCTDHATFVLQRSDNAIDFTDLHTVDAVASDCENPFQYSDEQNIQGKKYYRLLMKNEDGILSYSNIICLDRSMKNENDLQVIPNPANGKNITITLYNDQAANGTISIYDISGRILYNRSVNVNKGEQQLQIPDANLSPGIYSLIFISKSEKFMVKFSVQ